jgi:hypothetical protein
MTTQLVTPDDLRMAASTSRDALQPLVGRDWSVRAGDLDWDVRTTLTHVCDGLGWYAARLAARCTHRLRVDFHVHDDATNTELLNVLDASAAMLAQVAAAAPPGARGYHNWGIADVAGFVAMGCDELLVHTWDATRGLGHDFSTPADLADRLLGRLFPWAPAGTPRWRTLLWANGRIDLPGHAERLAADWTWHSAPLDL